MQWQKQKKSCLSQSKPGGDSLLSLSLSCLFWSIPAAPAGEGAQPWLSHLLSARAAQKMLGNLMQALHSMLLELLGFTTNPFLDTSGPGRFLEDKLRLSAMPAWVFWRRRGYSLTEPSKELSKAVLWRAAPSQLSRRGEPSLGFESRKTFSEESKSQSDPVGNMECAALEMCSPCSLRKRRPQG